MAMLIIAITRVVLVLLIKIIIKIFGILQHLEIGIFLSSPH